MTTSQVTGAGRAGAHGDELTGTLREQVDAVFAEWDRPDSPGCSLSVTRHGKIVYRRGYGLAHLEYNIPIRPDTVFHVASVSKQFTAYAILLLARDGRLALDDEVRRHLPWVPDLGSPITLRHLIHHTSGMRDQWELLRFAGWRSDDVITQEHLLAMVRRQRDLNFPPGSEHLYCNTGYTLLAETVAAVSGQSFREYTRDRIFRPLGMADTFFYTDHEELVRGRAYSYARAPGGGFKKSVLSFANAGATSLFTTADDLAAWLLHLDRLEGTAEAGEMQTRFVLAGGETIAYAAGLSIGRHRGLRTVGHSGSDAGYRSFCGRYPDQQLGVVVLANFGSMSPAALAAKVAEVLLSTEMEPLVSVEPEVGTASPASAGADLAGYAGYYIAVPAGVRVDVSDAGGALVLKVAGEGECRAIPAGTDRFWVAERGQHVTFARGDGGAGAVNSLTVAFFGSPVTARRAGTPLAPEQAAPYLGDYYSAELETTYRLSTRGVELVIEHQRLPVTPLIPLGEGEFQADRAGAGHYAFDRDAQGALVGFRLGGGRCRNIVFRRVREFTTF